MGLGHTWSAALLGVHGHLITVEAHVAEGLPGFTVVGLPDAAVNESRDRVRAATANAQCPLPARRLTVNLSPASIPKSGSGFDLAVAASVLAASGQIDPESVSRMMHLGELGLDGRVRGIRGVLPAVMCAVANGHINVVVPAANAAEAALVPGAQVTGVRHLSDVVALHRGEDISNDVHGDGTNVDNADGTVPAPAAASGTSAVPDLADVVGQTQARVALEVAAAGGHHVFFIGPPGAGKTMLAARLPGIMPDLADAQALEVTAVHSVAGTLSAGGLMRRPPFESPHHSSTMASLVGGGNGIARPGAISRAHGGVLFLDEAPEFETRVLDALRQPLEAGSITIDRARGSAQFPAQFQLVLAANPCPCGRAGVKSMDCSCTPMARRRYFHRLSGPLLDRMDIQVSVAPISRLDLLSGGGETTAVVADRVRQARQAQEQRLRETPWRLNSQVPGSWLRRHAPLPATTTREVDQALERGRLSARGYDRVIRLAWTIGDVAGRSAPHADDIAQALVLRQRHTRLS